MELTKNQDKGFQILARGIKRKFPFIKGFQFFNDDDSNEPTILTFLEIIIDAKKFFEVNNVEPEQYVKYNIDNLEVYFGQWKPSTLSFIVSDEFNDKFNRDYNEKLESELGKIYDGLPDNYKVFVKSSWDDGVYPTIPRIMSFIIT
jgi:hypothetical protein